MSQLCKALQTDLWGHCKQGIQCALCTSVCSYIHVHIAHCCQNWLTLTLLPPPSPLGFCGRDIIDKLFQYSGVISSLLSLLVLNSASLWIPKCGHCTWCLKIRTSWVTWCALSSRMAMVSVEYAVILLEILQPEVNIEIHSSDLHTLLVDQALLIVLFCSRMRYVVF